MFNTLRLSVEVFTEVLLEVFIDVAVEVLTEILAAEVFIKLTSGAELIWMELIQTELV